MRTILIAPSRRAVLAGLAVGLGANRTAQAAPRPDGDWIPFDDSDGLISFAGAINDHPVRLTLDSGAGRVVIDKTFAEKIGLDATGETGVIHGLAQNRSSGTSGPVVLKFGPGSGTLQLPNTVLADLSAVSLAGYDAPVLLGRDIFELTAVDLDLVGKRIAFRQSGGFDTMGFQRLALRARNDLRQIQISIENQRPVWGIVDLGSGSPLAMSQAYASSMGLFDGRPTSAWISSGVDGVTTYHVATASSITIAGHILRNVPFDALPVWNRANTSPVNIGYPMLSRLGRVIIDYRTDTLLVAIADTPFEPFAKNRIGLALIPLEPGFQVAFVAPGSPANQGGWKVGDIIAAINGDPALSSAARSVLGQSALINFTMADKTSRQIVPADYY